MYSKAQLYHRVKLSAVKWLQTLFDWQNEMMQHLEIALNELFLFSLFAFPFYNIPYM